MCCIDKHYSVEIEFYFVKTFNVEATDMDIAEQKIVDLARNVCDSVEETGIPDRSVDFIFVDDVECEEEEDDL